MSTAGWPAALKLLCGRGKKLIKTALHPSGKEQLLL